MGQDTVDDTTLRSVGSNDKQFDNNRDLCLGMATEHIVAFLEFLEFLMKQR
jgi:hypothetical protein